MVGPRCFHARRRAGPIAVRWRIAEDITTGLHHIAITYKRDADGAGGVGANDTQMYLDGVVKTTETGGKPDFSAYANTFDILYSAEPVRFGAADASLNLLPFNGWIDEIELFSGVLSPAAVTAIDGAGTAGKCKTTQLIVNKTYTTADNPDPGAMISLSCGDVDVTPAGAVEARVGEPAVFTLDDADLLDSSSDATCTATETPPAGFVEGTTTCTSVSVNRGQHATCGFENTPAGNGLLEVRKFLFPSSDPGRFNLLIDNVIKKASAKNGGTTGEVEVEPGDHVVKETAAVGSLSKYISSIICKDENGTGSVVASKLGSGPLTVPVGPGDDVVCIIQNFRKPGS